MSDMKLIMENFRAYQLDEILPFGSKKREKEWERIAAGGIDPEIKTVGDLSKAIRLMRATNAGGEVGKLAAATIADALPGLGNIKAVYDNAKDASKIVKNMYGLGDDVKTNTNLDKLNIDDNVSKIVDDPVEMAFLNYLIKDLIPSLDPETPMEKFDVNKELQNFLIKNFDGTTVKK